MLLLVLRGALPTEGPWGFDPRWIYGLTVLVVGAMLLAWRRDYGELARQNLPNATELLWAVAVGLGVFVHGSTSCMDPSRRALDDTG